MRPLRPTVRSLPLRPVGCLQALFEAIEALLPERTVLLEPLGRLAEPVSAQTRRPQLRRAPACDQPCSLEHLEVLGHRLNGDRERLGELVHRRLPVCEAGEDRTPGRVRKSGKRLCELVDRHTKSPSSTPPGRVFSSDRFSNYSVEYGIGTPGWRRGAN